MTTNSMAYNRTLFLEDNLPVLRGLDSDSIDLIATDPPFNKGVPAFEGTTKAGINVEFKDVWNWDDDVQGEWIESIRKKQPKLFNVIHYANEAAGDDMGAFLCFMAVRVLEMHRVLKDTGSIYLHCDSTASHYLKAMMDAVFGRRNFRNDLIWKRATSKKADARRFGSVHDSILFYVKSDDFTWNTVHLDYDPTYIGKMYRHDDGDGRGPYRVSDLTQSGWTSGESGMDWRGISMRERGKHWITPTGKGLGDWIVENVIPNFREIKGTLARLDALDEHGLIYWPPSGGMPCVKRYLSSVSGPAQTDVVDDIPPLQGRSSERTGYPTQKPLKLYKRMIEASSNPGDIVLDPFAGCATTCIAAEQLGREWIGIDIREEAREVIFDRLQKEVINGSMAWNDIVRVLTDAPERTDDGEPAAPELVLESPKKNAPKIPLPELRKRLIAGYGLVCQGCGWVPPWEDDSFLEADHMKPSKVGGEDKIDNRALLCPPCNGVKSFRWSLQELRGKRYEENRMTDAFLAWWETDGKWDGGFFDARPG